ncbi:serine/threonine-protein kinase [Sphaerisporangium aureirubrum]|uniref:non-specific serine/threonine protein kinase n=1 Tax=Sphaerisporangium aureirubrum TaxID=1544736 RepID=A0ABW1NNB4_9ACTN
MDAHRGEWRVPGYTEVRELGVGGSGRVVLARYDADQTPVAIKYLSDELRADPGFIVRFRHEARLLELVDSPHSARFYEYVESDGGAAIVMELVDGVSLRALLRSEGPTGPEAALTLLKGALLGLATAHASGVVHRDFKPENIMVEASGHSKLLDFGIAVRPGDGVSGAGTPPYMAPEQWAGAPAGPSTDVYAATIVFFECLTGTRPFQSRNVAALARQHQSMPPPVEQVPAPLRGLVERGMAKHPANRPPTADAFLVELEAVAAEAYGPDWEDRGRRRLAGLAALLALLFPLGGEIPDASTSMAETDLGGGVSGAARKLSIKIVAGVAGLAVVAAVTAVLVGSLGDPDLQAQETPVTPTPAVTETIEDPSAEPAIDQPVDPSDSPSDAPTTPVPVSSAAAPPTGAAPTSSAAAPPKPTTTKKPPKSPIGSGTASPSPKKSGDPKSDPDDPDVDNDLPSGKPKPKPTTPPPPPPPTTQAPTPTRTRPSPQPSTPTPSDTPRGESSGTSPSQSSPPPRGESDGSGDGGSPAPDPDPSTPGGDIGLLAAGLVTTGAVPATLVLRRRMAGRHRRR